MTSLIADLYKDLQRNYCSPTCNETINFWLLSADNNKNNGHKTINIQSGYINESSTNHFIRLSLTIKHNYLFANKYAMFKKSIYIFYVAINPSFRRIKKTEWPWNIKWILVKENYC